MTFQGRCQDLEDLNACERALAARQEDPTLEQTVVILDEPRPDPTRGEILESVPRQSLTLSQSIYRELTNRFVKSSLEEHEASGKTIEGGDYQWSFDDAEGSALRAVVNLTGRHGFGDLIRFRGVRENIVQVDVYGGQFTPSDGDQWVTLDSGFMLSLVDWIGRTRAGAELPELVGVRARSS